ncbi:MAG: peptidylprolyl isomerase [Defluviitaleaceae bacterium]|nr:peptidylprolyl isomerase [Defluviitaleaceae bacterium]
MKKIFLMTALLAIFAACTDKVAEPIEAETGPIAENQETNQIHEGERINMGTLTGEGNGEVFSAVRFNGNRKELPDGTIYERLLSAPSVTLQLTPLTQGEELAVLHTNHGDITLRFFPEEAPLAVENFKTHARNGFYDGLIFHRVIPGFMIQGGCPLGLGRGGESIYEEGLGLERSFNLHHFNGALATAHAGPGRTIGSQFYIVQSDTLHANYIEDFEYLINIQNEVAGEFSGGRNIHVRDVHPADGLKHYIENGGTPWLDWHWNTDQFGNPSGYGHTVFGHVVTGMDVVSEIAHVQATPNNHPTSPNRPIENVIIERISFMNYGE